MADCRYNSSVIGGENCSVKLSERQHYALDNGHFRAIFTKETFNTTSTLDHPGGIVLQSTVLSKLHEVPQNGFKIIGGKSGTTYQAGQCWATLAIKDDVEYIAIVMGAELEDIKNPDNKH
jgi:D-alanyl-D-alanine carboxypeptidase (penicillin-binding protein 5/6)